MPVKILQYDKIATMIFVVAIFISDQLSKLWVVWFLSNQLPYPLPGGFVRLTLVENEGLAFGYQFAPLQDYQVLLFIILVCIALFLGKMRDGALHRLALALMTGGASGNLFDRIYRGKVIDFIELNLCGVSLPVFNFADIFITIGIGLFLYTLVNHYGKTQPTKTENIDS
jgi:signal peptidase II